MKRVKFLIIIGLLILVSACATTRKDWEKAVTINTSEAYQEFLDRHPQSGYSQEAKNRIERSDWVEARRLNTLEGYQAFLQKHPDSKGLGSMAKAKIEELNELEQWQKAKMQNSIASYEAFVKKYPNSRFIPEATENLENLYWRRATTINTVEAYREFMKKYPNSKFSIEAKRKIVLIGEAHKNLGLAYYKQGKLDDAIREYEIAIRINPEFAKQAKAKIELLYFEKAKAANTIEAYEKFLRCYPEGELAEQAKAKIEQLYFGRAETANTIEAYEEFLQRFPESSMADQAKKRIELLISEELAQLGRNIPALEKFIQRHPKNSLKARELIEDILIEEINAKGIGSRFKIADILPEENGHVGRITISPLDSERWLFSEGLILIRDDEVVYPFGSGSVIRFKGKVSFLKGYSFEGDEVYPLSFLFLENVGFVYLCGRGKVILKDGTEVKMEDGVFCPTPEKVYFRN